MLALFQASISLVVCEATQPMVVFACPDRKSVGRTVQVP